MALDFSQSSLKGVSQPRKLNVLLRAARAIQLATKLEWRQTAYIKDSPNHVNGDAIDLAPPSDLKGYAHKAGSDPMLHRREALLRDLMRLAASRRVDNDLGLSILIAIENNHLHVQVMKDAKLDGSPIAPGTIVVIPYGSDRTDIYPNSKERNEMTFVPKSIKTSGDMVSEFDLSGDLLPTTMQQPDIDMVSTGDLLEMGDIELGDFIPSRVDGSVETGDIKKANAVNRRVAQEKFIGRAKGKGINPSAAAKVAKGAQQVANAVALGRKLEGKIEPSADLPFIQVTNGKVISVNGIRFEAKTRARDIAWSVQNQRAQQPFKNVIQSLQLAAGPAGTTFSIANSGAMPAKIISVYGCLLTISSTMLAQNAGKLFVVTVSKKVGATVTQLYNVTVQFMDATKPMDIILLPAFEVDGNYYTQLIQIDNTADPATEQDFLVKITGGDGTYDQASLIVPGCEDPYTKRLEAAIM